MPRPQKSFAAEVDHASAIEGHAALFVSLHQGGGHGVSITASLSAAEADNLADQLKHCAALAREETARRRAARE